jgi:hypothetical protein
MSGVTTPCPGQFLDKEPELLKRVTGAYDGEPWINFEYGGGRKWDGKPIGCSWYA